MVGPSFTAVLDAAAAGDEAAFRVLWRDLQPRLLRYLDALAPGAGEDLASETWLRVVDGLTRFSGDERAFRAWVFMVARHRAVDRWRRRTRRHDELVPVEALADLPAVDDPAEAALDAISTQSAVALLATLPRDQAEVVLLRVVAGLDVAQVATITGKRPGTVRVLAHRALRRLAQRLDADERVRGGGVTGWGAKDVFPAEMPDDPTSTIDPLDDDTAERLLAGRLDPLDAPPPYAAVARLLQAAAAPPTPDELAGEPSALAAFRSAPAAARSRPPVAEQAGRRGPRRDPGRRGAVDSAGRRPDPWTTVPHRGGRGRWVGFERVPPWGNRIRGVGGPGGGARDAAGGQAADGRGSGAAAVGRAVGA